MIIPDIFANLKFYSQDQGGREMPTPSTFFSCILVVNNSNHDARLLLEKIGRIYPGDEKNDVPIKFLCSDLVLPKIKAGDIFYIKDGKIIAEGIIKNIVSANPPADALR